ncbi:MAG: acyl-CoA dehydrogenase, partial [Pseudonocardiaceae bacterium]
PLEQYVRDSKIDTLYEGTTAIQGQDLFFRKIVRDRGATLTELLTEVDASLEDYSESDNLADVRAAVKRGIGDLREMVGIMSSWTARSGSEPTKIYRAGLNTTRLLLSLGDLLIGWLLLRHAVIAERALAGDAGKDVAIYRGKTSAARFFAHTVLPELAARAATVATTTDEIMELPEEAF